ncbi:hypothetical protein QE152_g10954 [Popillia japonica]|uniref:Endonuclease/exonuclease/phosphatase domain-containing protein n=1 Tax=Popillia japonica TaxID=7064 RepID=A0AAW1LTF6_POPJA
MELMFLKNCKFLFITEHWLYSFELEAITIPGFTLASFYNRRRETWWFCYICMSTDISFDTGYDLDFEPNDFCFEFCAAKVHCELQTFLLICIYRSPSSSFQEFYYHLEGLLAKIADLSLVTIAAGDFNVDFLQNDPKSVQIKNILTSFNAKVMIREPTKVSTTISTCLDNIIVLNAWRNPCCTTNDSSILARQYFASTKIIVIQI